MAAYFDMRDEYRLFSWTTIEGLTDSVAFHYEGVSSLSMSVGELADINNRTCFANISAGRTASVYTFKSKEECIKVVHEHNSNLERSKIKEDLKDLLLGKPIDPHGQVGFIDLKDYKGDVKIGGRNYGR
jgi:hypothetical protein